MKFSYLIVPLLLCCSALLLGEKSNDIEAIKAMIRQEREKLEAEKKAPPKSKPIQNVEAPKQRVKKTAAIPPRRSVRVQPTVSYSSSPTSSCCFNGQWTAHADLLYWRPCTDGYAVGFSLDIDNVDMFFLGPIGQIREVDTKIATHNLDFDHEFGFRLGLSYQPCDRCYDVSLSWTYFSPSASSGIRPKRGARLLPFAPLGYVGQNVYPQLPELALSGLPLSALEITTSNLISSEIVFDEIKGHWDLTLNFVDFSFGHRSAPMSCLYFHPHVGFRFASIQQDLRITSLGRFIASEFYPQYPPFATGETTDTFCYREKFQNDFMGFGPKLAFDTGVELGCGAGLYGNLGLSLLYGEGDQWAKQTLDNQFAPIFAPELSENPFRITSKKQERCVQFITDCEIGAYWNRSFCNDCYQLHCKLGWEHHILFDQNAVEAIPGAIPLMAREGEGNLSTQGLVFSARIEY